MKKVYVALTLTLIFLASCESFKRSARKQVNRDPKSQVSNNERIVSSDDRIVRPEPSRVQPKVRAPLFNKEDIKYRNIVCEDCWEDIEKFKEGEVAPQKAPAKTPAKDEDKPWFVKILSWWPMFLVICIVYTVLGRKKE